MSAHDGSRVTFGDIRGLIARTERVSLLFGDLSYDNYASAADVPDAYDRMEVGGIGTAEVEFPEGGGLVLLRCVEVYLLGDRPVPPK